jgi:hypothetical protein
MARGNAHQQLFHEDDDYRRMTDGLEKTVARMGWEIFAYLWMPNHIHLFFRTPKPDLSKGIQYLLSGYANRASASDSRKTTVGATSGGLAMEQLPADPLLDGWEGWLLGSEEFLYPRYPTRPDPRYPENRKQGLTPGISGICDKGPHEAPYAIRRFSTVRDTIAFQTRLS